MKIPRVLASTRGSGMGIYCLFVELELIFRLPRSYYKGVEIGYLTKDPAALNNPRVCDPYIKKQNTTTQPS